MRDDLQFNPWEYRQNAVYWSGYHLQQIRITQIVYSRLICCLGDPTTSRTRKIYKEGCVRKFPNEFMTQSLPNNWRKFFEASTRSSGNGDISPDKTSIEYFESCIQACRVITN